uniref:Ataxin-10 domain-containing protein n=1 Tax=Aureoumbra lagunensis TaxID=44058 RepID=A0A7S3JPW9_9STRA|mmetsp:Transcript_5905/g.8713  ORF Transcript_5905/g.8713 Transcript_5905/m.8713 type:complete len:420 (-) Transcript_5905:68-1327(-)|eukprot:CAMPEP_0197317042 /NCGR_PEP_ID=MMETSP0891-20130614/45444_1 /TAXON_ID=44058 ORGANISM="Aureoumbra lagunensis, Strain CCMP1510" /NCGR_SAMPLE_ID=MMETSP0891 /ASSEMBLY_ACC=CAM_ASM_000534 /LENGTH=419 /DNA_ID=CAMNT_0042806825 /DNA_START=8 /DNA_END=1267 /DNA_ORIENTATION=-
MVLEQTLTGIRALRDNVRTAETKITKDEIKYLCNLLIENDARMACAASQCLANLAAAGERELVWSGLMTEEEVEQPLLTLALERWLPENKIGDKTRAAIIAAIHNCICKNAQRARLVAAKASVMDAILLVSAATCYIDDGTSTTASEEWTHLLFISLLSAGATSFLEDSCRFQEEGLRLALDALQADPVFFHKNDNDQHNREGIDVALLACKKIKSSARKHQFLDLLATAIGHGPPRRADLVTDAGVIPLALEYIEEAPISVLQIIANVCYHVPRARNQVRPGIPSILSKCVTDVNRPLQREWAIFAIRNICQDNIQNQAYIYSLQPQALDTSQDTLESLGLRSAHLVEEEDKPRIKLDFATPYKTKNQCLSKSTTSLHSDSTANKEDQTALVHQHQPSTQIIGNRSAAVALLNEEDFM